MVLQLMLPLIFLNLILIAFTLMLKSLPQFFLTTFHRGERIIENNNK